MQRHTKRVNHRQKQKDRYLNINRISKIDILRHTKREGERESESEGESEDLGSDTKTHNKQVDGQTEIQKRRM